MTYNSVSEGILAKNEIDDKALIDLWEIVKVSEVTVDGIAVLNFDSFAPASVLPTIIPVGLRWLHDLQLYSDQPVSVLPTSLQASLPRWLEEKDTRVAMLFGWAFERAVGAYFQRQDAAASLYREWSSHRESGLHYSERDSWDQMLQSGVQLLIASLETIGFACSHHEYRRYLFRRP